MTLDILLQVFLLRTGSVNDGQAMLATTATTESGKMDPGSEISAFPNLNALIMSHSTTTTSTYLLQKYSKSYPKTGTQSNIQSSEWQHFTNAIIRLALDIKKAEDGQLESVRLRILWSMNPTDDGSDQNDVVFVRSSSSFFETVLTVSSIQEDLDLLSFSSPSMQGKSKRPIQGLPLKAVYRDSVVGIRYLHSRVSTNPVRWFYRWNTKLTNSDLSTIPNHFQFHHRYPAIHSLHTNCMPLQSKLGGYTRTCPRTSYCPKSRYPR